MTKEYAEKNAIKRPWGDILYRNLQPRSRDEAIEQGFYPCMVRGPQPADAHPSSLLWCRDDVLFKCNFQFAQNLAKQNKKTLGLDFNPGPSAPRADGTRDAEPNVVGPFYNLEGLITHILVQGTAVNEPVADAESDEAPTAPKPKKLKKPKESLPLHQKSHGRSHCQLHLLKTVCSLKIYHASPSPRRSRCLCHTPAKS